MSLDIEKKNFEIIKNKFGFDLAGLNPDATGSNTEVYIVGDQAIRISVSEECNRALYLASKENISGLVKTYDYVLLQGDEFFPFRDAALVSRLDEVESMPNEIIEICQYIQSGNDLFEDNQQGLLLAEKYDRDLRQGLEFVLEYAKKSGWDADINPTNFMFDPVLQKFVISDPMV